MTTNVLISMGFKVTLIAFPFADDEDGWLILWRLFSVIHWNLNASAAH